MKKSLLASFLWASLAVHAQVKIGNNPGIINSGSMLEMESTNKGLLIPRLTTTERTNMGVPADGMLIYNKNTDELNIYNNSAWQTIPNSYTFKYATSNVGETLTSNGINFEANDFIKNMYTHILIGYLPADSYATIDALMVNGNIRVGKNVAWTSAETDRIIKFGNQKAVTVGEELADDKLVFRAKNFSFLPSIGYTDANVGIGTSNPLASLHVRRGTGNYGTAAFEGTTNTSLFNYSVDENTYINGGKAGSSVFLNYTSAGNVIVAAGGGNVGIQTSSPQATLHVKRGTANATAEFDGTANNSHFNFGPAENTYITGGKAASLLILNELSSGDIIMAMGGGKVGIGVYPPVARLDINGTIKISGGVPGAGKLLTSDANGLASWQAPAGTINFKANSAVGTMLNNNLLTQVSFASESFDNGNSFNIATSTFTAPSSGVYYLFAQVQFPASVNADVALNFIVGGNTRALSGSKLVASTLSQTRSLTTMLSLSAGEQVIFAIYQNSGLGVQVGTNALTNYFIGYKVN